MEKKIYYFINYETNTTAIGECNPPYMKDRGYTLVTKEEYDLKNAEIEELYRQQHPEEFEQIND